jgi:hypothetical protein
MQEFNVFEKIQVKDRSEWHLYIDAIYKSNPKAKNLSGEVLSKLLTVGNQGGFRFKGSTEEPSLVVLFTSGEDIYWRDTLDTSLGLFLYYGDQKTPGKELHDTKLHGNLILKNIFEFACSDKISDRKKIPPIFIFKKVHGRDIKFLGLAVPGIQGKPHKDWLTAVWGANKEGNRFLNYKSFFTILDTSKGSNAEKMQSGISLAWLTDIEQNKAYESEYAPFEWKKYIDKKNFVPLTAFREISIKTKEEQLPHPEEREKINMLKELHSFFIKKDNGYSFEKFACSIVEQIDPNVVSIDVTRPYKDGGIDGVGIYRVFGNGTQSILVDFYLQAKCYNPFKNAVGIKDTARLISRIKNRQFGIMVTTSYVHQQAYKELLEDRHPIVLITGKDIIELIYNYFEVRSVNALNSWLQKEFL